MHVVIPWPTGLSLLLHHNPLLLSQNSHQSAGVTPLGLALAYSGTHCNASDHFTPCYDCNCSLSVQLLLEADCSVTVGRYLSEELQSGSLEARILFFQHLKNRRERLRDVSIAYLPADIIDRYAVTADSLPDGTAEYLWTELMERARASNRPGISPSESLRPQRYPDGHSIFTNPLPIQTANLALIFGFKPWDECGLLPLLARFEFRTSVCGLETSAAYTNWLLQHNLKSSFSSPNVFLTADHYCGAQVGSELYECFVLGPIPLPPLHEFNKLLSKLCFSNATSRFPCPCVSEPFHRPIAYLVSSLMSDLVGYSNLQPESRKIRGCLRLFTCVIDKIEIAVPDLEVSYLARCAAHMFTMSFLGIKHFPTCRTPCWWFELYVSNPIWPEDWLEIAEEDRLLVEILDDLDVEFEQEFEERNESAADFLRGYCWNRLKEVKRDMKKPLSGDERSALLGVGVVLEEGTNSDFDSHFNEDTVSEDDDYEHEGIGDC